MRGDNLRKGAKDGDKGRKAGASAGGRAHSREHMAEIGRAGWKKLVASRGLEGAVDVLVKWRLSHPSLAEQKVIDALNKMGIEYRREVVLSLEPIIIVDFVVGDTVIEVCPGNWKGKEWRERRETIGKSICLGDTELADLENVLNQIVKEN